MDTTIGYTRVMKKPNHGFTLIELMITIAVVAVMATLVVPSFRDLIAANRLTTETNDFIAAVNKARSEAIKRSRSVRLTAVSDSSDWGDGWIIWVDNNDNDSYDTGEEVQSWEAVPAQITFNSGNGVSEFIFTPSGRANVDDTLTLCDDRTDETGREISISLVGRPSVANFTCT